MQGALNPAGTGFFNFVKTRGNPIDPVNNNNATGRRCIDIEADNPHLAEDLNFYNHPNCSCSKVPVLMDSNTFKNDLKEWTPGSGGYLDNWYYSQYLPNNR